MFPQRYEYERNSNGGRLLPEKRKILDAFLYRVEGLCLIKPGNETSMIRFGRVFSRRPRFNRESKRTGQALSTNELVHIKYAGTRGTRNLPTAALPSANLLYRHRLV